MEWVKRYKRKQQTLRGARNLGRYSWHRLRHALGMPQDRHIVICGYPRSGTSLLYNMMTATLEGFAFDEFENVCLEYAERAGNFISKRPLDVFNVPHLVRQNVRDKEITVLVSIRDFRDILTSRHPRVPDRYFIGYDACIQVDSENGFAPEAVNPGIGAIARAIEKLHHLPNVRVIPVRYEDLVADADAVQKSLRDTLDLRFSGPFSAFHRKGDSLAYRYDRAEWTVDPALVRENKPVDSSRAGKWRAEEHRSRIIEEFETYPELFTLLDHYDYEPDDTWFESYLCIG